MKTLKLFLLSVLESLEFGWQAIRYALNSSGRAHIVAVGSITRTGANHIAKLRQRIEPSPSEPQHIIPFTKLLHGVSLRTPDAQYSGKSGRVFPPVAELEKNLQF